MEDSRIGPLRLAVDFQQPLAGRPPKDLPLPIVRADGVAYQSGLLAVEGSPELDVQLSTAGVRRVDVGELADAEYQPGRRLLGAFGFVGDAAQIAAEVKISVARHPGYPLYGAIAEQAELRTLLSAEGLSLTNALFMLRAAGGGAGDPAAAAVATLVGLSRLAADLAAARSRQRVGRSAPGRRMPRAEPVQRGAAIAHRLPNAGQAADARRARGLAGPGALAPRARETPAVQVPLAQLQWNLELPAGYEVVRGGGTLESEQIVMPTPAPLVLGGMLYELAGGVTGGLFTSAGCGAREAPRLSGEGGGERAVRGHRTKCQAWSPKLEFFFRRRIFSLAQRPDGFSRQRAVRSGGGTLTLSGANTFSGGTTVTTGTLTTSTGGLTVRKEATVYTAPSNSENRPMLGGAAGSKDLAGSVFNGTIYNGGSRITLGSDGRPVAVGPGQQPIRTDSGSLTMGGTGLVTNSNAATPGLSGANTFTGAVTLNGGNLTFNGGTLTQNGTLSSYGGGAPAKPPVPNEDLLQERSANRRAWAMPANGPAGQSDFASPAPKTPAENATEGVNLQYQTGGRARRQARQHGGDDAGIDRVALGNMTVSQSAAFGRAGGGQLPAKAGFNKLHGLETLRSPLIDFQAESPLPRRVVRFESLGEAPRLDVTLARARRTTALGWVLALATFLIGVALERRSAALKATWVLAAAAAAMAAPWAWQTTNVGIAGNMVFYAVALVVLYYALAPLARWLGRGICGLPCRCCKPSAAAALVALAVVALGPSMASAQQESDGRFTVQIVEPPKPVQVPEDAVVRPYDAQAAEGVKPNDRLLVPYAKYVELWNLAHPDKKLKAPEPPADYALAGRSTARRSWATTICSFSAAWRSSCSPRASSPSRWA